MEPVPPQRDRPTSWRQRWICAVNLSNSLGSILSEENNRGVYDHGPELNDQGKKFHAFTILVPQNGAVTLKVTIVWTDPAASTRRMSSGWED